MSYLFNIRDYGAVGDGLVKDTNAVQRTIDACAEAGGGRVVLPAGTYLCGTLYLKSNVEFHLAGGAVVLGSPDLTDYNKNDVFPENQTFSIENVTGAHLIVAYCQENVSITGTGTINGNSTRFFGPLPEGKVATYRFKTANYPIVTARPAQMVFFCRCRRVSVQDVKLLDSTYWNLFLLGCEDVQIRGITISNPPATQNGDGIDIDCSRNVTVSDCVIRSGDDCITIRANRYPLGDNARPCENITVTNCVLRSPTCAFRVGVGDGEIRNCSISNIVVAEARTAVNMISRYSESARHGTQIEQVHFSDFVADVCMPFVLGVGPIAQSPAYMRNISFSRFRVTARAGSQVAGNPRIPMENFRFTEIDLLIKEGSDNCEFVQTMPAELSKFGYHGQAGQPSLPCAIYGVHLNGIALDGVRVRWETDRAVWQEGIRIDHSRDVEFRNVCLRQPKKEGTAIRWRDCEGTALYGSRAAAGTDVFLRIEESPQGTELNSAGNDLSAARQAIKTDEEVAVNG